MLPDHHVAGSPENWLRYAYSDLEIARVTPSPGMLREGLCFHAQQTAEKALKAVLVTYNLAETVLHWAEEIIKNRSIHEEAENLAEQSHEENE